MKKTLLIVVVAVVGLAVAGLVAWHNLSPEVSRVRIDKAKIAELKGMVRLCAVDFYEDVPVRASVGSRHMFGRVSLTGSVSFDIEKIKLTERDDTIFVTLPPEIVEVYEATSPQSYEVIDTWNDRFLRSSNVTTAEENKIKAKVKANFRKAVYAKGYVRRARKEAVTNLANLFSALTRRPVVVTDPTPGGTPPGH